MITLEQYEQIRRMYHVEEQSERAIARTLSISRQTVSKALRAEQPPQYTLKRPRPAPMLGPYQVRLDTLLAENAHLPKKQRYTAHKLFELLQAEGYSGSESSVQMYGVRWRKTHKRPATFLPLEFDPGQDAQVDWGEAQVILAGVQQTVQVFVMHLSYSRRTFVMCFPAQKQEAFLYGHVRAFEHFGGVPHRISYDNLAAALKPLIEGRVREEQRAFVAFRSHYLFASHFCTPAQGHEKGGVEGSVGFSRRNYLVPMPQVESYTELNRHLLEKCLRDDVRVVHRQSLSIGQAWKIEQPALRPLPKRSFDCCVTRQVHLTPYSQVSYDTNRYSVPAEQARKILTLKAYPFTVEIYDESQLLAQHARCYGREQDVFNPLHYLFLLEMRPGAFEYARPLRQWKVDWPPSYHRLLAHLREKWPQGRGVKEFVRILRLHQQYPAPLVEQAIEQALTFGCTHLDGVKHCLEHASADSPGRPLLDLSDKPHLAILGSQAIDLACYDQLIARGGAQ
jgi:transposase